MSSFFFLTWLHQNTGYCYKGLVKKCSVLFVSIIHFDYRANWVWAFWVEKAALKQFIKLTWKLKKWALLTKRSLSYSHQSQAGNFQNLKWIEDISAALWRETPLWGILTRNENCIHSHCTILSVFASYLSMQKTVEVTARTQNHVCLSSNLSIRKMGIWFPWHP